jgi:hypothetical protein
MSSISEFHPLNKLDLDHRGIDQLVALVAEMDQVLAFRNFIHDAPAPEKWMNDELSFTLGWGSPGNGKDGIDDLAE